MAVTHIHGRSQVRSASKGDLAVSEMKTATYGGILFQAAAPVSAHVFKTHLKTYLFRSSYGVTDS